VSQENVKIIRQLTDAFNRRDYAAVLDAIDPEVEWHPPPDIPNAAVAFGRDALIANFQDWFGAWEDYRAITEEILEGADDAVVVFSRESARGKGSGIELRSRRIFGVFHLRERRVVRQQAFLDRGEALRAAGLRP
jgi:ketosteroid isomerase-like protein